MTIQVMGVLNVTPDSFYDGGRYNNLDFALERAHQMVAEGADILDIGGESTRPFAPPVSPAQEQDRILPIIERLTKELSVSISVDTRHPDTMKAAIKAGANIINDINALQTPGALATIAKTQVKVCLMHMQGEPGNMQVNPQYDDVTQEINQFLASRIQICQDAGIAKERIWVDPGIGFGKNLAHNLALIGQLSQLKVLGCPILVGLSRKSMFQALLNLAVEERLPASLAGAVLVAIQGASIVRTHDVKPTRECISLVEAVLPYWRKEDYVV